MTAPLLTRPAALLPTANPAVKILAVVVVVVAAFAAIDPVTPALLLIGELGLLPLSGSSPRLLALRAWPVLVGAAGVGLANALLGTGGGRLLVDAGPITVTSGAAQAGAAIALRVLAIALPGVLVLAVTDPVDLADSLVQQWHVPARFAYGTLAAVRLLPLLSAERRTIALARRARGVDAGHNPVVAIRLLVGAGFALLVGAIRRGTRLAAAMDARGFDAGVRRTVARPQRVGRRDVGLVLGAVALGLLATTLSLALGSWQPLFG